MEVYLLESIIDGEVHMQLHMNVEGTNIWLTDEGCSEEHIVNIDWTDLFWEHIALDYADDQYTYIGEL